MPSFQHDNIRFHYLDAGQGLPFFFQHGLGGDVSQPFGLFQPPEGIRLITFDCRGHGQSEPLGDPEKISIATFADDLRALMDHLNIREAVIGGISMGSAIALNLVLRFPDRVQGLVLSRPAWLEGPIPRNVEVYSFIARLVREHGPRRGQELFQASPIYAEMLQQSPDVAGTLLRQFESPRINDHVVLLERIPNDRPLQRLDDLKVIDVPTLVLANREDPVHPFDLGQKLARAIPNAEFREVTSKTMSKEAHTADVQRFIEEFLEKHFVEPPRRQRAKNG